MGYFLPINSTKYQVHGCFTPFYYIHFPFELNIALKEDDIKNVLGYNFFQLPFWAEIIYIYNNLSVLEYQLIPGIGQTLSNSLNVCEHVGVQK